MDRTAIEDYIKTMPGATLDYPFGKDVSVYKVEDKMFALIQENKTPLQLSLKCDPGLALLLREKYDEIMPGYHLNKKHWNTLILAGQVPLDEVQDLIRHSYMLVTGQIESNQ